MLYTLRNYQRDAVDKIKKRITLFLEEDTRNELVFKSPTGSGKTYMISSLLEELVLEQEEKKFCFIWACPGKGDLHKQSYQAVKRYVEGNPHCSLLENEFFGSRKFIKNKEIVFINWEKLIQKDKETGKWANNLMKDQEGMNFFDVLKQTKSKNIKIVLIVDESHIGASQKARIQEFKQTIIKPDITLEMSATPITNHIDVEVNSQDVIDEGMIKRDVIVNEGITKEDRSIRESDSETLILKKAYEKRIILKEEFKKNNSNVNPLVLIQIPNVEEGEQKKFVIRDFLRERGITEFNGKLKMWCDDNLDFDKTKIRENMDITEFLVFKTSVATGWDCPRAHILIKFRDGKSETFEIQTIGRILRTPEAKSYDNQLLDNAYIYTNIIEFETRADTYNPNRIKTEFSQIRDEYTKDEIWYETQLSSFYRSRQGDYNSADVSFIEYYMESFMNYFGLSESDRNNSILGLLKERLEAKGLQLQVIANDQLMEETNIDIRTVDVEQTINSTSTEVRMSENDIQAQYYDIIRRNLNGLAYIRSKSPINSAIIECFCEFYNIFPRNTKVMNIQSIVVNNRYIFEQILNDATLRFRDDLMKTAYKKGKIYDFKIETSRAYSTDTHCIMDSKKSIYQPLYVLKNENNDPDNNLEKDFLLYLDKADKVKWYWENGTELMQVNFGIPYNNGLNTFQPDFIVKFVNGNIGIFDTKPVNYRIEDTSIKANALIKYIKESNEERDNSIKIIGGIVIKQGTQFFLFCGDKYHDFKTNRNDWINFNDILTEIN